MEEWDRKIESATKLYADTAGHIMINDAKLKENAKWDDRTGDSRRTMDYEVIKLGTKTSISLRGNTPHFKYLELCHEKKWAVLWPTIKRWQGKVLSGWAEILRKI